MPPRISLHHLRTLPEAGELPPSRAFARALTRAGASGGEVNLVLSGEEEVRRLNREFRGADYATDVLAFDYCSASSPSSPKLHPSAPRVIGLARIGDSAGSPRKTGAVPPGSIWGDVFVSAEAACRQARERDIPVREELARLFLHGCLHLLGFRDEAPRDRARMEAVQESLLREILASRRRPAGA